MSNSPETPASDRSLTAMGGIGFGLLLVILAFWLPLFVILH